MGLGDRIKSKLRQDVPTTLTKFGKAFALEEIKSRLAPHLPAFLDGFGQERLKFLVEKDISLWTVWEDKAGALQAVHQVVPSIFRGLSLPRLLTVMDLGAVAGVIQEILEEKCPQYRWIPREWLIKSLADFRKDL